MRRSMGHAGFTLIELILVVAVLSIMSIAAIPSFVDTGGAIAEGAARKLVSDLSLARKLARNRSGVYGITFDSLNDSYTVHSYDPATGVSTPTTDPLTQSPMVVDFADMPGLEGTDIQSASFGGTTTVRFNSQGVPQNGSGTALNAAGSLVIASGSQSATISVQPNTGEVDY